MVEGIGPLSMQLAQLLGDDMIAQSPTPPAAPVGAGTPIKVGTSPFEDILSKAVDSLESLSAAENRTNQLIDRYVRGEADLQDVMIESSKLSIQVQLAVTTINLAVTTFKEITQMQI